MSTSSKISLVTGGSRSLGRDMALNLAQNGQDLIITYRSQAEAAAKVVAEIEALGQKAVALQLDMSKHDTFPAFVESVKSNLTTIWQRDSLDALVNNAGIGYHGLVGDTDEANFDALFNIHFKGVYFLTQAFLPILADGGSIVNVSTGLTRFAIPGYSAYASMKGAIETYTQYLAKELGGRGIRANVVAPGAIDTDFNAAAFEHNPGMRNMLAGVTTLGRVGQATDIGKVVAFLASEQAGWITGQRLEASGGMFL
ncbi:MAG: SDR family oxidoreductase [Bacteroidota bacterium]